MCLPEQGFSKSETELLLSLVAHFALQLFSMYLKKTVVMDS